MDFTLQLKLNKNEWNSIETPVSKEESEILQLILDGYQDPTVKLNKNKSFIQLLKIDTTNKKSVNDYNVYFFHEYFNKVIDVIGSGFVNKIPISTSSLFISIKKWINENVPKLNSIKMKKADLIRIEHLTKNINKFINVSQKDRSEAKGDCCFDFSNISEDEVIISCSREIPFEYILLKLIQQYVYYVHSPSLRSGEALKHTFYLYTLLQLKKNNISFLNEYLLSLVNHIILLHCTSTGQDSHEQSAGKIDLLYSEANLIDSIIHHGYHFIEKNGYLLKYEDMTLFSHQNKLFSIFRLPTTPSNSNPNTVYFNKKVTPKLVLYTAPTGTGKTLSPIGLSQQYRIIFVCVARHVGLSLAKSAVSVGKKIAFAFGCESASDIRLHYLAAVNYTVNKKSGGIGKVDNSCGNNVEIIICDVMSYLIAMYYMLSFNPEQNIITYWDEPTITMDYETHPLHEVIHRNWEENKISKVVLSSATLPSKNEIHQTITDFQLKFANAEIYHVSSHDCKKSISLLDKDNNVVLPHSLFKEQSALLMSIENCEKNKTLLRYFDLRKVVEFIELVIPKLEPIYKPSNYFENVSQITMETIKLYYLFLLKKALEHIPNFLTEVAASPERSERKLVETPENNEPYKGVLLTTTDAHTLTDGPTIYIADDVDKLANFFIKHTKIPSSVIEDITTKIKENESYQSHIDVLEKNIQDLLGKDSNKEKKMKKIDKDDILNGQNKEVAKLKIDIENISSLIKMVNLNAKYIPNTIQHQQIWSPLTDPNKEESSKPFFPYIEESIVKKILSIESPKISASNDKDNNGTASSQNVEKILNNMKILLLLGIGVFTDRFRNDEYMEIMKQLASQQKLYLIIAQSDYIYGTNYQFCHAFISKDLTQNMTSQKIIQAIGRVGRGKLQQSYTVRFRCNALLEKLFLPIETANNNEANNMNKLFSSS